MYEIDEKYIEQATKAFYGLIQDKEGGEPDTRYKSWEWCYQAFADGRKKYNQTTNDNEKEKIVDFLALHLAFYLASWGMYRGSAFLLQRDYKTHIGAVNILLKEKCDSLWGYEPASINGENSEQNDAILEPDTGLYARIKDSYNIKKAYNYEETNDEENATDTLVTKILMGTMGCIPAFDRFLKKGIKWLKYHFEDYKKISGTIYNQKNNVGKTFNILENLACANKDSLKKCGAKIVTNGEKCDYPIMKCVDMFLWQVGFELDLLENLEKNKNCEKNIRIAKKIGICKEDADCDDVINAISDRWKVE